MNCVTSRTVRSEEFFCELKREARALHLCVFNSEIPLDVLEKYVMAHDHYLTKVRNAELIWMKKALQQGLDLEALEFALRIFNKEHILVKKFKILVYISESFSDYYNVFVNERPQRRKAFLILSFHLLQSVYKFLKGSVLLLIHRYQNLEN